MQNKRVLKANSNSVRVKIKDIWRQLYGILGENFRLKSIKTLIEEYVKRKINETERGSSSNQRWKQENTNKQGIHMQGHFLEFALKSNGIIMRKYEVPSKAIKSAYHIFPCILNEDIPSATNTQKVFVGTIYYAYSQP